MRGPNRETWPLYALVDSGADGSVLPLALAWVFGYRRDELRRGPEVDGLHGTGASLRAAMPLTARVQNLPGHEFELDPIYVDGVSFALLGRRDFFLSWTVTFEEARQLFVLQAA